jgi:hypothetical protein
MVVVRVEVVEAGSQLGYAHVGIVGAEWWSAGGRAGLSAGDTQTFFFRRPSFGPAFSAAPLVVTHESFQNCHENASAPVGGDASGTREQWAVMKGARRSWCCYGSRVATKNHRDTQST